MALRGAIASLTGRTPFLVWRRAAGAFGTTAGVKGVYVDGPADLEIADVALGVVDPDEDTIVISAHGLETGDGPVQLTTDDTLPAGLELATNYWIIVVDDDMIKLAASLADAMAQPGVAVDLTDAGIGAHTLADVEGETQRRNEITLLITASIQPVDGEELVEKLGNQRMDEVRIVFTETRLRGRTSTQAPDEVEIDGERWIVIKAQWWEAFGGAHSRAFIARTEVYP